MGCCHQPSGPLYITRLVFRLFLTLLAAEPLLNEFSQNVTHFADCFYTSQLEAFMLGVSQVDIKAFHHGLIILI